ncbi:MAG: hypothetical protein ABIQ89_00705 [Candidatus Saccharimonadales bacterium]
MSLLIALSGVFALLVTSELLWRQGIVRGELARKLVHISVGTFVAFWPYFMSWQQIQLMSLAFFAVVLVSFKMNVFHAIHSVKRKTWGELLFPIGIGLSALIMPAPIVFTAAILHLSLADGFAAVVGKHYGVLHQYTIRNYTKTLAGTLVFFVISLLIVTGAVLISGTVVTWPIVPLLIWLPAAATAVENISLAGTDNIFVPLLVILVLQTVIV